ncbi:MAG: MBL fold metallo-hydrolase [Clostridia bacterium]|nr:MBL fold metallo-hydrolase [Clostridia bacterium]
MKITALIENTANSPDLLSEHGLSFYAETGTYRLMFDFGLSDGFIANARTLGIDMKAVDIAFLSHGHHDHGGGLAAFLNANSKASVYAYKTAFSPYFVQKPSGEIKYIGLDSDLASDPRIILTGDVTEVAPSLTLFAGVTGRELFSDTNSVLMEMQGEKLAQDRFVHEQNLFIDDGGRTVLLAGCAHNGIINILERCKTVTGKLPDVCFGGFHLSNPTAGTALPQEKIASLAARLADYPTIFYTCHCTGLSPYAALKEILGDKVRYISGGDTIDI